MLNAQRGQTMPFWFVGILISLAMCFFLINEADMLTWQIHAQNAADSAAAAGLSPTANVLNQESVLLYATAVDEYRLRYLDQAILNTINWQKTGACNSASACQTMYAALVNEYNGALSAYSSMYQLLQRADNFTEGGQQADENKVLGALGSFDPAFQYTNVSPPASGGKKNSRRAIDLIACRSVPYLFAGWLGLKSGAAFQAIGRAAANAVPVIDTVTVPSGSPTGFSEYFKPSSTNPKTGQPYQPNEDPANTGGNQYLTVNFSNLTLDLNWYSSQTVAPTKDASKVTVQC